MRSPFPVRLSAPVVSRIIFESTWEDTVKAYGQGNAAGNIGLKKSPDDIRRWPLSCHDQVNTAGSGLLGEADDSIFEALHILHQQIGKLIDDNNDVWSPKLRFYAGVILPDARNAGSL